MKVNHKAKIIAFTFGIWISFPNRILINSHYFSIPLILIIVYKKRMEGKIMQRDQVGG